MPKIPNLRKVEYIQAAMQSIVKNGGSLTRKEVFQNVSENFDFDEEELKVYPKSGHTAWRVALGFWSLGPVKAGWLTKNAGVWYVTPEGEKNLALSTEAFGNQMGREYQKWKESRHQDDPVLQVDDAEEEESNLPGIILDTAQARADESIDDFIGKLDPYAFQDLVAALLRGMGYYTPYVAPMGRDGGVDIRAYRDPFGTTAPRLHVQVKRVHDKKTSSKDVRELAGLLKREGDTGLFVAIAGFTSDALDTARDSLHHIETLDLPKFRELWKTHYKDLSEEDKKLLPLRGILYYAPLTE